MIYTIKSKVIVDGIGTITDEHKQEFSEDTNVFGRVLEYHRYMYQTFPNCQFRLISAKEVMDAQA